MNSNERLEEIWNEVKEIKKLLSGNGDIGFCERVRNNEKNLRRIEKQSTTILTKVKLISSAVFYAGGAISIIAATIKWVLK
jgi:hypothetical protein